MKKNQYKQYIVRSEVARGRKWQAIVALTALMAAATVLCLLIDHATAPADVITTVGLWI